MIGAAAHQRLDLGPPRRSSPRGFRSCEDVEEHVALHLAELRVMRRIAHHRDGRPLAPSRDTSANRGASPARRGCAPAGRAPNGRSRHADNCRSGRGRRSFWRSTRSSVFQLRGIAIERREPLPGRNRTGSCARAPACGPSATCSPPTTFRRPAVPAWRPRRVRGDRAASSSPRPSFRAPPSSLIPAIHTRGSCVDDPLRLVVVGQDRRRRGRTDRPCPRYHCRVVANRPSVRHRLLERLVT